MSRFREMASEVSRLPWNKVEAFLRDPETTGDEIAQLEQEYRDRLRGSFHFFCVQALREEGYTPQRHHRVLIRALQETADTPDGRLMVWMPPGSAKSTFASKLFPAWLLMRDGYQLVAASHTMGLAKKMSRSVQRYINEMGEASLGYYLTKDATDQWETSNGGEYKAAGVGVAIAGFRADMGLIDDPTRSREAADRLGERMRAWDWFEADFRTRLKPRRPIVVVGTRWGEDDLQGLLLQKQPGMWRIIRMRAVAREEEDGIPDPLGRKPGEYLWDDPNDPYGYGDNLRRQQAEYEASGNEKDWESLYQQEPVPPTGLLFQTAKIDVITAMPHDIVAVARGWDLAATEKKNQNDPDFTVGVKLGFTSQRRIIVMNVVRVRAGPHEVSKIIRSTASQDGVECPISIPRDPGQAGVAQALEYVRLLNGYAVTVTPESGSKRSRANPFAAQMNGGNVAVVAGAPWFEAWRHEMNRFPSGKKDDQVDATARAYELLASEQDSLFTFAVQTR